VTANRFHSIDVAQFPSPDGLREMTIGSNALQRRVDLTLFAPKEAEGLPDLPLIILLHGVYGSHWAWARSGNAHQILQTLTSAQQIRPAVLAMPSDGLFGVGSGYLARPEEDVDRWITQELPEAIQDLYPGAGRSAIGIAGLSMGGWGALRLAARHPGRFSAAVALSPLTTLEQVAAYAAPEDRARHAPPIDDPDLLQLMTRDPGRLPPIKITCGTADPLISQVRELHQGLQAVGLHTEYSESAGGHTWAYWREQLPDTFRFIDASAGSS